MLCSGRERSKRANRCSTLAVDDLAAGRLVRLCDVEVEDDYSWFVVWREPLKCDRGDFEAFTTWLQREAQNYMSALAL
jgi:hypothetical protein